MMFYIGLLMASGGFFVAGFYYCRYRIIKRLQNCHLYYSQAKLVEIAEKIIFGRELRKDEAGIANPFWKD